VRRSAERRYACNAREGEAPRNVVAAFGRKPPLALPLLGRASGTRIVRRSAERRYACNAHECWADQRGQFACGI